MLMSTQVESTLPLIYDACRRARVPLAACDLSLWCWHGVLPYLTAWRDALDDDARARLGPSGAKHVSPARVPAPGEIAAAAEVRFAAYAAADGAAERWAPLDADAAAAAAAAAAVDGAPLRAALAAQAARVLRLAAAADGAACTEARAEAALVVAAGRYHARLWLAAPGDGARPRMPWRAGDAVPPAHSAFAEALLRPRGPATGAAAAADRLADALDRAAHRAPPRAAPAAPGVRPLAPPAAVVARRTGARADAAALADLAAARLRCPPPLVAAAVAALRGAVDAAVYADDRRDAAHAARLDADARDRVPGAAPAL